MARLARSCMQSLLKLVNSGMTMVGISMILYALWMFRGWQKHLAPHIDVPLPWFIYTFLGIGITMCIISCSGHIAAETANGCCLYIYMVFLFLIVMIEAAVTTDVFLNHRWEEDFPEDQTGNLDHLKHFIKDNFDICKWIGLSVVAVQGLSLLFAMVLKALGPHPERYYESDDDYLPDRVPLLRPYVPPPNYALGDPVYGSRNNSWNIRVK
ncbi:hypothetical protein Leryth_019845 [Lithospermum erythrorhizon]|nr:hypothetical protein Leryth_019845 [Lithospermum erythrorhizon]